jgi:hypothetical protein
LTAVIPCTEEIHTTVASNLFLEFFTC